MHRLGGVIASARASPAISFLRRSQFKELRRRTRHRDVALTVRRWRVSTLSRDTPSLSPDTPAASQTLEIALPSVGTQLDEGPGMKPRPLLLSVLVLTLSFLAPTGARADPLFDFGQGTPSKTPFSMATSTRRITSRLVSPATWAPPTLAARAGSALAGFHKSLSGKNDIGGIVVLGLALDRIATGPVHRVVDVPRTAPAATASMPAATPAPAPAPAPAFAPAPAPASAPAPKLLPLARPALARKCVAAALRTSGLGTDDDRIDSLIARARASAWLPETRMRAMRLWTDAANTTTLASTDTANFYDAVGANLVLELRLTWRLDRLVFAGDEPTLERVRLERLDARSRLATRTLESLFAWQRAKLDEDRAADGSPEKLQAAVHAAEARATLDVLTGGWFSEEGLAEVRGASARLSA